MIILESHLIGDGVMTLGMIAAMRAANPKARIILLANSWMADLLDPNLEVDFYAVRFPWSTYDYSIPNLRRLARTLVTLRKVKADLACETRGDPRNKLLLFLTGAKRRIAPIFCNGNRCISLPLALDPSVTLIEQRAALLRAVGLTQMMQIPSLPISIQDKEFVDQFLAMHSLEQYNVLHPGASQAFRSMTLVEVEQLLRMHPENSPPYVMALGSADQELGIQIMQRFEGRIAAVFRGSLLQFAELCRRAETVVTMDSGPAHIAGTVARHLTVVCKHDSFDIVKPLGRKVERLDLFYSSDSPRSIEGFPV